MTNNELNIVSEEKTYVKKLKKYFKDTLVYKSPKNNMMFSTLNIPVFIRDWLIMKFSLEDGSVDQNAVTQYVKRIIPNKEQWNSYLIDMLRKDKTVRFLGKVRIDFDTRNRRALFSLPDFNFPKVKGEAVARWEVIDANRESFISQVEVWGILEINCTNDNKTGNTTFNLISFKPFCPYKLNPEYYIKVRDFFTVDEWIDVLIGAFDYSPEGYKTKVEKLGLIKRMLPFVEKRLNLIELAPKETGKSYVFSQISKYGWLISGGSISRAKLFYDISKKSDGLVAEFDYIALDEVQSIKFMDPIEIQGALKGYLESGEYRVGDYKGIGDAGLVLLGNIDGELMNIDNDMFRNLPEIFHESALVDRFHGFIKGWEIPKMREDLKMEGWALNTEYFSEILHSLRNNSSYRAVVDSLLSVPKDAATRDTEAIKRLTTGFVKLLFPNAVSAEKINISEFVEYCLKPAMEMRGIIKKQLGILDSYEFGGKDIPKITVKTGEV